MLAGMKEGQAKMSKSDPDTAIFMEDSIEDVNRKIKKAFCPEKVVKENPILDYCEHIILPALGAFTVNFKDKSVKTYSKYEDLQSDFADGTLHPGDLKPAVSAAIN
jgi:tyrosyl-tRNA synthetase